jgi:N-acetylglucosaminyl-diphospho-decaprenol L-rhamnosyltransferase
MQDTLRAPASSAPREVFAPCAAAALYARDTFLAAGGFEESFFCYLEDVDLGFRLRLGGAHCIQVQGAEVRHMAGAPARTAPFRCSTGSGTGFG